MTKKHTLKTLSILELKMSSESMVKFHPEPFSTTLHNACG